MRLLKLSILATVALACSADGPEMLGDNSARLTVELPTPIEHQLVKYEIVSQQPSGIHFKWSHDPSEYEQNPGDRSWGFFEIRLPLFEGERNLSGVHFSYLLPHVLDTMDIPRPSQWQAERVCKEDELCSGRLNAEIDKLNRTMRLDLDMNFMVDFNACQTLFCFKHTPSSPPGFFDVEYTPCAEGACADDWPCAGSVLHPGDSCMTPEVVRTRIHVRANAVLTEANFL